MHPEIFCLAIILQPNGNDGTLDKPFPEGYIKQPAGVLRCMLPDGTVTNLPLHGGPKYFRAYRTGRNKVTYQITYRQNAKSSEVRIKEASKD